MTEEEIKKFALTLCGARADYPFVDDFATFVLRHSASRKWFGIFLLAPAKSLLRDCCEEKRGELLRHLNGRERVPSLNLKCEPALSCILRHNFFWVLPAYHMNKKHWITILPDAEADEEQMKELIRLSYDMTAERADK